MSPTSTTGTLISRRPMARRLAPTVAAVAISGLLMSGTAYAAVPSAPCGTGSAAIAGAQSALSRARSAEQQAAARVSQATTAYNAAESRLATMKPNDSGRSAEQQAAAQAQSARSTAVAAQGSAASAVSQAHNALAQAQAAAQACTPPAGNAPNGNNPNGNDQNGNTRNGGGATSNGEPPANRPADKGSTTTTTTTTNGRPVDHPDTDRDHPWPRPDRPGPDTDHGRPWPPGHGVWHGPWRPGDRNCADFATQRDAQRWYEEHRRDQDVEVLDGNHNQIVCETIYDDVTVTVQEVDITNTVVVTTDDGSTANVSGSQVTEVPDGSAQTGSA